MHSIDIVHHQHILQIRFKLHKVNINYYDSALVAYLRKCYENIPQLVWRFAAIFHLQSKFRMPAEQMLPAQTPKQINSASATENLPECSRRNYGTLI